MENYKEVFMKEALRSANMSFGERGKVGIVATLKDGSVIKTCNNLPHVLGRAKCETEAPTIEEAHTLPEVLHAEEMLVCDVAKSEHTLEGADIYITRTPCKKCASHLVQAGINKLYYFSEHPHGDGLPILGEAGIPY